MLKRADIKDVHSFTCVEKKYETNDFLYSDDTTVNFLHKPISIIFAYYVYDTANVMTETGRGRAGWHTLPRHNSNNFFVIFHCHSKQKEKAGFKQ